MQSERLCSEALPWPLRPYCKTFLGLICFIKFLSVGGARVRIIDTILLKITSECKSLWGEPERVHRNIKQNIQATESTYAQHN